MNIFISIVVSILLVVIIIKQIIYIKRLKISTLKSIFENFMFMAIVLAIIIMTIILGKSIIHYVVCSLFVMYFITSFLKQGILEGGIVIINRGKDFISWSEIKEVEIEKKDILKVTYFADGRLEIITHNFNNNDYEKVFNILNSHGLKINTKYN